MNRIKLALFAIVLLSVALWSLADTLLAQPLTWFSFRTPFIQLSGVVASVAMGLALWLATRPRRLEPVLDGLDKMYRLHKWLGITALVAAVLHWWFATGTKWMVGWGWLERPARGPRAGAADLGGLEGWLRGQRGLAESVGEWAFYAAAALIVVALVQRIPYRVFRKTHVWISVAWLALVFHIVVLTKFEYWSQPVGWWLALTVLAGLFGAVLSLTGGIGRGRRVEGSIEFLQHYPALEVLESRILLEAGWPGHTAGQFAFVVSDAKEGAHPYTIASAWDAQDRRITFISKALGDHTARLHERLKVGMRVSVEGPYGCFDFDDGKPQQIWVGAGIGITPFIARMKQLAVQRQAGIVNPTIDLFHPTPVEDAAALAKLHADAEAAGVHMRVWLTERDGRLDGERIRAAVPEWQQASLWFCGPAAFGQSLRSDFVARGLRGENFHQELFEMR